MNSDSNYVFLCWNKIKHIVICLQVDIFARNMASTVSWQMRALNISHIWVTALGLFSFPSESVGMLGGKFSSTTKLQSGSMNYKMSPQPESMKWWVVDEWNINFEWTIPSLLNASQPFESPVAFFFFFQNHIRGQHTNHLCGLGFLSWFHGVSV